MIFNSFEFIFLFLPIVFIGYFLLNRLNFTLSKVWLLVTSLFFYSWWNPKYLPLILISLLVNYAIGTYLGKEKGYRKSVLTLGIVLNVALLGYYKYYDFFITNLNVAFSTNFNVLHLLLPLAISFYTFQQIAYLVDSYRLETKGYNFLNYGLFVTFFPQLIAGPIVHHSDVMSQFEDPEKRKINYRNIGLGLLVFAIGIFKKVGIADTFAVWANKGYSISESLTFVDAWMTSLSYTFQLYFDFSGYSDMAIGAGLLFNIVLPRNFNSPYKAVSIQDFWRRWHITLSSFLTNYIYIPLGGNRKGVSRTYINIMIIFFVSGIWHGAGWTFIVWGLLHGIASVINRLWSQAGFKLNKLLAWFITFQFVNATWVFFRAPNFDVAMNVLKGMVGLNGFALPDELKNTFLNSYVQTFYAFPLADDFIFVASITVITFFIAVFAKNSLEWKDQFKPNWMYVIYCAALLIYSVFQLQKVSAFLYFNF
ncbi:MBOAT family O-acyltransferase [Peribacillus acanthi]|uniref:MBOAT family O-acyltransferase n=1 Tax=Peribacillus acanthi TaxID=2171554 RepID=UPI000D3ED8CE|nr:MBOAT family protein [Peribacillus acanthi]